MDWHRSVYGARAGRESTYGFDPEDDAYDIFEDEDEDDDESLAYGRQAVITQSQLKRLGGASYYRAYELVQGKRLHDLVCLAEDRQIALSSTVINSYQYSADSLTSVRIDLDHHTIVSSSCSCPAFGRYRTQCKHVIALIMLYNESPEEFKQTGSGLSPAVQATSSTLQSYMEEASKQQERARRQHSLELLAAVDGQADGFGQGDLTKPAMAGLQTHVARGSLCLQPMLAGKGSLWTLRLHICQPVTGIVYLVKDLYSLVHAVRNKLFYSYGKKLAFVHSLDSFDQRSQDLLEIIEKGMQIRSFGQESVAGYYRPPKGGLGEMLLSEEEVCDILALFVDSVQSVEYVPGGRLGPQATQANVLKADPDFGLSIEPVEASGQAGYRIRHQITVDNFIVGHSGAFVFASDQGHLGGLARRRVQIFQCSPAFAAHKELVLALCSPGRDSSEGLFLSRRDVDLFSQTVLPALAGQTELSAGEVGTEGGQQGLSQGALKAQIPPDLLTKRRLPCQVEVYLDRDSEGISCDLQARYGDQRFHIFSGIGPHEPLVRDKATERLAVEATLRYFPAPDGIVARIPESDNKAIYRLLSEGLPVLRRLGQVYSTPAFDGLSSLSHPTIKLGLSIQSGLVEISPIADEIDPQEVPALLESYRKRQRYHRLRNGAFVDLSSTDFSQLQEVSADLGLAPRALESGPILVPAYEAYYWDAQVDEDHKDESFKEYIRDLKTLNPLDFHLPASLQDVLRPYQEEGFRWLNAVCSQGFGGILADEMGLGKTVQLLAFLASRQEEARQEGPSLIVCPASLVYNWVAECHKFVPELTVAAVAGSKAERRSVLAQAGSYDLLVTSYDLLRRDIEDYRGIDFFCQTLDEAQYIKNHATKSSQAVRSIQAQHRFALTGTPIENRLSELWSIFDFLMPSILGSYRHFRERFELPIISGDEQAQSKLQNFVGPFILRRRKAQVLQDLPDKVENVITVQLEGEQRRIYAALEQRLRMTLNKQKDVEFKNGKIQVLAQLTRLRQVCCDPRLLYSNVGEGVPDAASAIVKALSSGQAFGQPSKSQEIAADQVSKAARRSAKSPHKASSAKLDAIEELVSSCQDAGRKMLIFSQFTSYLDLIAERLRQDGVAYKVITGATPKRKRLELVDSFNQDDTPVFLISLKAGNTGLNLTGACVVVHADPWWNAAAQEQANDRAHRIGQTQDVNVYQIVAKDTIEERILALQESKSDLASRFVDAASASGASISALTKDDLLSLLG